jgi:hypothetical protein
VLDNFQRLLSAATKFKLKGGIFNVVCRVLIVTVIALAALAAIARNVWVTGGTIFLVVLLVGALLNRIIRFAEHNPAAAILENTQFWQRERIIQSKGTPELTVQPSANTPEPPNALQAPADLLLPAPGDDSEHFDEPEAPEKP